MRHVNMAEKGNKWWNEIVCGVMKCISTNDVALMWHKYVQCYDTPSPQLK